MGLEHCIVVRGAGDIATGTIYKLVKSGFPVLALETAHPSAIRRRAAFSEAVYEGSQTVEGMTCRLARDVEEAKKLLEREGVALLTDEKAACIPQLKPLAVVDAVLAKKNLGTNLDMAPITVGLGPGFTAGKDVDIVVETMRGHDLGRLIYRGGALADTGTPGLIGGYGKERVVRAPAAGVFRTGKEIGDLVEKGETIASICGQDGEILTEVRASLPGVLRGLLRDGYPVTEGFKAADIDPRREQRENCFSISDKARCIAGGVLEAILQYVYLEKVRLK